MNSYKICNLYSGSGGNCTLISAREKNILIDAGKSAKSLCRALASIGMTPKDIDAIFVTHEHRDHIVALRTMSHKFHIPIHILLSSAEKFRGLRDEQLCECLCIHQGPTFSVELGDIKIGSFPTPHDSRGSVGYRISFCDGEKEISLAYATDIGVVTNTIRENLFGCESIIIESNHDVNMLLLGPYPPELKMRIRSEYGHLSHCECAELLSYLCKNGTKNVLLAHLSEENNTPELALGEARRAIADESVRLLVASPDLPTWLVE